jgi:cardiolipin synthase
VLVSVLSSLEIAYVVVLSVWIVLQKRSPVATLAWILALSALPIVGFIVYVAIGPRRLSRKRMRHAKSRTIVRDLAAATASSTNALTVPWRAQLATLALRTSGASLAPAKEVLVLNGGAECFDAIESAIREAKSHVHVLYYIFESDQTGTRIRDALIERAKAGVKVRVLVDAVGSPLPHYFVRPLLEAGAEFASFNPVIGGRLRPRINFRNHRKIVICDGNVGFLGGINVGDEYNEKVTKKEAYRDTHMMIVGSAVRELQFTFLEDWTFATDDVVKDKNLFPGANGPEPQIVQLIPSGPDLDWEPIQNAFFTAITSADESVLLTTPYFVPDEAMSVAITTAALRGVDVQIIVPARSDSRIVSAAARSYYDRLLAAGAKIYEYPKMIHAKTMVIDGKAAFVGSANMDNRSFRLNFEVSAVVYCPKAIAKLKTMFDDDRQKCRHITSRSRNKLPILSRFAEASARLLSPLL